MNNTMQFANTADRQKYQAAERIRARVLQVASAVMRQENSRQECSASPQGDSVLLHDRRIGGYGRCDGLLNRGATERPEGSNATPTTMSLHVKRDWRIPRSWFGPMAGKRYLIVTTPEGFTAFGVAKDQPISGMPDAFGYRFAYAYQDGDGQLLNPQTPPPGAPVASKGYPLGSHFEGQGLGIQELDGVRFQVRS